MEFLKRFKMQKKVCQKQFDEPREPHSEVIADETVIDGEQKTILVDQSVLNEEADNTFR